MEEVVIKILNLAIKNPISRQRVVFTNTKTTRYGHIIENLYMTLDSPTK